MTPGLATVRKSDFVAGSHKYQPPMSSKVISAGCFQSFPAVSPQLPGASQSDPELPGASPELPGASRDCMRIRTAACPRVSFRICSILQLYSIVLTAD